MWAIPAIDAEINLDDVIDRMLQEVVPEPPEDDPAAGLSLLQTSSAVQRTARANRPRQSPNICVPVTPSAAQVEVHWIGDGTQLVEVALDASFSDAARCIVSPTAKSCIHHSCVPADHSTHAMHCRCGNLSGWGCSCFSALNYGRDQVLAAYFSTLDHFCMCRESGVPMGNFLFAGKPWLGIHEWVIPGMRLSHVRTEIESSSVGAPSRGDVASTVLSGPQLQTIPSALAYRDTCSDGFQLVTGLVDCNRLLTGLDPHMFESLFDVSCLQRLCRDIRKLGPLHPATVDAFRSCMIWQGDPFQAVRIYSDGSFHHSTDKSAWAICVLVLVDNCWQFAGFACDVLAEVGHSAHLGNDHNSAHIADLAAMAQVALVVGGLPSVPIEICFDAVAAAGVAEGRYWSQSVNDFADDAMNELVDTAAKTAVAGNPSNVFDAREVAMLFHSPEVTSLWWQILLNLLPFQ